MSIYTKTGDGGKTSLIGGTRVKKNDVRLEAYGTVDELNAWIGMIRSYSLPHPLTKQLQEIQNLLFVIGSNLATDRDVVEIREESRIQPEKILLIEQAIDEMEKVLPPLHSFVLPAGDQLISSVHIARTVCRRSERRITELAEDSSVDPMVIQYINRLSDYLFTVSRYLAHHFKIKEESWLP